MTKIPDLPPPSGAPGAAPAAAGEAKQQKLTGLKASEIDVESMALADRLALHARLEASLPATSLRNVSLEKTLVLQLLTAQELQKAVLEDEAATPTHKSQVTNTLSGVIDTLSKLQIKLFASERMKEIEAVLIDTVNEHMTPEQQHFFIEEYKRRLGVEVEL
jgi:hypothetical protein